MLIEMHVHTFPASSDSVLEIDSFIDDCKNAGLDGALVTNHYDNWALRRTNIYADGLKEAVSRWSQDIWDLQEKAKEKNFLILPGMEYSLRGDIIHISVIGLTKEILKDDPPEPNQDFQYLKEWANKHDLLLIQNHPIREIFDDNFKRDIIMDPSIGYEIYNTQRREKRVSDVLKEAELMMEVLPEDSIFVCGGDAHVSHQLGYNALSFSETISNTNDLKEALLARNYSIVICEDGKVLNESICKAIFTPVSIKDRKGEKIMNKENATMEDIIDHVNLKNETPGMLVSLVLAHLSILKKDFTDKEEAMVEKVDVKLVEKNNEHVELCLAFENKEDLEKVWTLYEKYVAETKGKKKGLFTVPLFIFLLTPMEKENKINVQLRSPHAAKRNINENVNVLTFLLKRENVSLA